MEADELDEFVDVGREGNGKLALCVVIAYVAIWSGCCWRDLVEHGGAIPFVVSFEILPLLLVIRLLT